MKLKIVLISLAIFFVIVFATLFIFSKEIEGQFSFDFTKKEIIKEEENKIIYPKKLINPPTEIKAVYATSWTAAEEGRITRLIELIKRTELNAMVIDIKDYTGQIFFQTDSPLIKTIGSEEKRLDLIPLINRLHQENIYTIARVAVFQDPFLAKKRPDLAVKSRRTNSTWKDRKGLAWVDPSAQEVWNYTLAIAQEADKYGFDEINFDYIRFPSDGDMADMVFPFYATEKTKSAALEDFFSYLSANLRTKGIKISADLFGLATINKDDLGIGQILEKTAPYFDFICPMIYPSHYASGFNGYKNPANYPYEVIKYSLDKAQKRLADLKLKIEAEKVATTTTKIVKEKININLKLAELRPWLQDFDLGADYTASMIRKEKQAVYDSAVTTGWLLWDPKNIYTEGALDGK